MPERLLNLIGGQWVPARSGGTFPNTNPANGELLGEFPDSGPEDVADAVEAAQAAKRGWRLTPVPKRAEIKSAQFAKSLDIEPLACIAFEASTFSTAANNGRMVVDVAARSPASRHFARIAEQIAGRPSPRHRRAGRFALMRLWGR